MQQRPFTASSFFQYLSEQKLMASHCPGCDRSYLPPRAICPNCHNDQMEWTEMSGRGKLSAFTAVHVAPTFMMEEGYGRDNPYCAGIVELEEGLQISAQILGVDAKDAKAIQIGSPLKVEFIQRGKQENKKTYLAFRPS
jgi:uncharacterized OB-fold protein